MSTSIPQGVITSLDNPTIRRIRRLHFPEERTATGLFLVEGLRFIHRALASDFQIETLIVCQSLLAESGPLAEPASTAHRRVPLLRVTPQVFLSLSRSAEPQGIAAVVRQRRMTLSGLGHAPRGRWLALQGVGNPGNIGTTIRTAEAAGFVGVILLEQCADLYDPMCVRATMGSIFGVPVAETTTPNVLDWARRRRIAVIGTSPSAAEAFDAVSFRAPLLFLMGSERQGLTDLALSACDRVIAIPVAGQADSLNVAVAAGIVMFAAQRTLRPRGRRHKGEPTRGRLPLGSMR